MRPRTVFALVAVVALVATSCASRKDTGFPDPKPETSHPAASPSPTSTEPVDLKGPVDVADNVFEPVIARVKVGTTVVWVQSGAAPHTVTADDDSFDSHPQCLADQTKCMHAGDRYERAFKKAGEFPYYCRLHGSKGGVGMTGKIIVEA